MNDAPRRKRVPRAERELQILAAAEEVFAERGFQNTSMDEVSLRVGVSKPMLYEYFSSKEGLLLACVARIRADLHSLTLNAVSAAEPKGPRAVLEAGLEAYFDFADRHGRAWAVLLNESVIVAGPAEEAIEAIRGQQTRLLEEVLGHWLPSASPTRLAIMAHALVGAGERVARWRLRDGSGIGPHETAVLLADAFWPGFAEIEAAAGPRS
ncbi:AcrR family transcriptional regulator [Catenulispora sp. MAP12-49]|jgi:AcrR family transcriptional regulator|uniref:TetR/AcrR family transcriptional regulator n=1 Tax=unclassified Catenulispora TaxID=414885 RepID=UPI00351980E7